MWTQTHLNHGWRAKGRTGDMTGTKKKVPTPCRVLGLQCDIEPTISESVHTRMFTLTGVALHVKGFGGVARWEVPHE